MDTVSIRQCKLCNSRFDSSTQRNYCHVCRRIVVQTRLAIAVALGFVAGCLWLILR